MKKLVINLILICLAFKAFPQTAFTVSGTITGIADGKAAIRYTGKNNKKVIDSCTLKNGTFELKGDITGAVMGYFSVYQGNFEVISDSDPNVVSFFLEPAHISVSGKYGHLKQLKITGSKTQAEYDEPLAQLANLNEQADSASATFDEINKKYQVAKKDSLNIKPQDSLKQMLEMTRAIYESFDEKRQVALINFTKSHPNSHAASFLLAIYDTSWPIDSVKAYYNKFNRDVKADLYGSEVKKFIDDTDASSIGKKANDFTTVDINGKPVHLSDFAGKVVLLDFWASWCVPCRQSTPHLLELFKKYDNKLNVIAISDDDGNVKAWKQAIETDGTNLWINVLRGAKVSKNNFDITNSINEKFAIHGIPVRILIDKNGIIVGRYGGTEDNNVLDKKLAEVFGGNN